MIINWIVCNLRRMKQKYLVVIEKADNNYSAFSPDVEGCVTTGDTLDETIKNMKEALEFHLEALDEIPEPKGLKQYIDKNCSITEKLMTAI